MSNIVPASISSLRPYRSLRGTKEKYYTAALSELNTFKLVCVISSSTLTDEVVRQAATEEGAGDGH